MSEAADRRPRLLWPALLTAAGVVVLGLLGFWQIARMGEKRVFIERLQAQALAAPAPLPAEWPGLDLAALDLAHATASGRFVGERFASVRTTIAAGGPGSRGLSGFGRWIFQPLTLDDGRIVLVNRGFVPESRLGEIAPLQGPATVTGYLRAPETRNSFTPIDQPQRLEFFTRDTAAIAASLGVTAAPFYLEAERVGDGRMPPAGVDVAELIARIPDNHLSYALTWFGLAATLVGVFVAFALQARRGRALP